MNEAIRGLRAKIEEVSIEDVNAQVTLMTIMNEIDTLFKQSEAQILGLEHLETDLSAVLDEIVPPEKQKHSESHERTRIIAAVRAINELKDFNAAIIELLTLAHTKLIQVVHFTRSQLIQ